MHVLTATSRTQGQRANDYTFTIEGELVRVDEACGSDQRDPDGGCGCGRGFAGMSSCRATTTALVRDLPMTATEFELLRYFVQHTGQVVTREQILNAVWGYEEFPTTRTIDNFVAKLRQKIERSPHAPEHILTIHGSGYKFVG